MNPIIMPTINNRIIYVNYDFSVCFWGDSGQSLDSFERALLISKYPWIVNDK